MTNTNKLECLTEIPFELDPSKLMAQTHVPISGEDTESFQALIQAVRPIARPKALYRECFIESRTDDQVVLNGITFTSRILAKNVENIGRGFAFVATCGIELDRANLLSGDFLQVYWLDEIKAALLETAIQYLQEQINRLLQTEKTIMMSPGSGDADVWPIEQQKELFQLLGAVEGNIGVQLTDSFLMIPNKSVSGIIFPSEQDFRTCQVCQRVNCPSRRAPFDPALYHALQRRPEP